MPTSSGRLRVLLVAHNAVAVSNRRRVDALAALPDLQVTLLSPPWWHEEGRRIAARPPAAGQYAWHVGRTVATGNGTRHAYLTHLFPLVRALQPDVIDIHEEPFSLAAFQALVARNALSPRSALVFYSAVNVPRRWRAPYRWIERLVLRQADGAYVPNGDVPAILAARGLVPPAVDVPLGVDVDRFAAATPADLLARLPGASRPFVGFLGRLEPVKGLDVLVEAAGRLTMPATIVVAGEGSERGHLERMVHDRGLSARVRFVGAVPFDGVPAFVKALDLLVLPSVTLLPAHREQFGRVLAEAMAAGVAVIGSSSGAIPEVVGDAGLIVREGDPGLLADAMARLVVDVPLRAALARRGQRRARERFAWPVVGRRTVDEVYRPAVARRRRARTSVASRGGIRAWRLPW